MRSSVVGPSCSVRLYTCTVRHAVAMCNACRLPRCLLQTTAGDTCLLRLVNICLHVVHAFMLLVLEYVHVHFLGPTICGTSEALFRYCSLLFRFLFFSWMKTWKWQSFFWCSG
jgi:hypothetical protein